MGNHKKEDFPDVSINSVAKVKKMYVKKINMVKVGFWGKPFQKTFHQSARVNMPPSLKSGETYRNAEIKSRIENIVTEELGSEE